MKQLVRISISVTIFILISISLPVKLDAKNEQLARKELKALLKKANQAYEDQNYPDVVNYYENYLRAEGYLPGDNLLYQLADSYWHIGNYNESLRVYTRMFHDGNIQVSKEQRLVIAERYARHRNYKQASKWLNGIEGYQARADTYSDIPKIESMKNDSDKWHLYFLDINSSDLQFAPFLADSFLYFTRNTGSQSKKNASKNVNNYSRLWKIPVSKVGAIPMVSFSNSLHDSVALHTDSNQAAELVKGLDDIKYNVGVASIDKNKHYYFNANHPKSGDNGVVCIYVEEGFYPTPDAEKMKCTVLPFGNYKSYSALHPAINSDGTLLVFSSRKPGGKGGCDLYYAQRKCINCSWGAEKSFGNNINTKGNEVFPTITSNGYLYFSSDALPGLGGLDIFRIPLQDALDNKGVPEHLSYPVNSSADDFGWTQDTTGVKGFFTSDRLNCSNIYGFSYNKPEQIANKHTISVLVKESIQGKVPPKATGSIASERKNIQRPDFRDMPHRNTVSKDSLSHKSNSLNTDHPVLGINTRFIFAVLFKAARSDIMPTNYYLLDALARVMQKYTCFELQIEAYTDADGDSIFNQKLSEKRAASVCSYLTSKGVLPTRLKILGLGMTRQVNDNKTPMEKAMNRRVLFHAARCEGCNLNVDSLLLTELVDHERKDLKKIFVLPVNHKFMIQVGAFKTTSAADALAEKMRSILPANIYLFEENGYHKVRVGFLETWKEAEAVAAIIEATGILF